MTTPWTITPIWAGLTVAILGAGPDMNAALAASARMCNKTIAVNRAVKYAPWADAFVALDPHHPFWEEADNVGFDGLRICGVECDINALYPGLMYETVQMGQGHTIQIRNNALAAIRIAQRLGAVKVVLLGFDPERYEEVHAHTGFIGLVQGLAQITAELQAAGVVVERRDSPEQYPGTRALRRGELAAAQKAEFVDPATFPQVKPAPKQTAKAAKATT